MLRLYRRWWSPVTATFATTPGASVEFNKLKKESNRPTVTVKVVFAPCPIEKLVAPIPSGPDNTKPEGVNVMEPKPAL
jgi:hypothetical protein